MSTKAGTLIYKCKRCGAVIRFSFPDILAAMAEGGEGTISNRAHTCNESEIGIIDLVGGDFDEEQTT